MWWWFQSIFHCIANWQDGFLKQFLVYWSTFIPRFVSSKISFVLGGIRFRFRLTDETLTHFLSFPSIQVNNCQKVSFNLFVTSKNEFSNSLIHETGSLHQPVTINHLWNFFVSIFVVAAIQKLKQKKLVFYICFLVTGWCNETNIILSFFL